MYELVQNIMDHLLSSVALKNEDDASDKFTVKINFNWEFCDFNIDIVGHGEEVITGFNKSMSKELFLFELLYELRSFSLLYIHIEISLIDYELNRTLFHTKSCLSFREKVIDLTGCSLLQMLELIIPEYDAEFFFYVPPPLEGLKYFITLNNNNQAAANSMEQLMSQRCLNEVAFICHTSEEKHNNIKKCIECALNKIHSFLVVVETELSFLSREEQQPTQSTNLNKSYVDLTDETESDTEETHDKMLREVDEDLYFDTITSDDDEDSGITTVAENFSNWVLARPKENWENEQMKEEMEKNEHADILLIADSNGKVVSKQIPNIYVNFCAKLFGEPVLPVLPQSKENFKLIPTKSTNLQRLSVTPSSRQRNSSFSSSELPQKSKKMSFSSTNHPVVNRREVKPIDPLPRPSNDSIFRPKLNRGSYSNVDIPLHKTGTGRDKPIPKSKLYTQEELIKSRDREHKLPEILEVENALRKSFSKKFVIPRKVEADRVQKSTESVLDNDFEPIRESQSRQNLSGRINLSQSSQYRPARTPVNYTDEVKAPQPGYMQKFTNRVKNLIPMTESPESEQARHSTPSSIKTFFDGTVYEEYEKRPKENIADAHQTVAVNDSDDDDEVMVVDENHNVKANQNVRTSKRVHTNDQQPHKQYKFFENPPGIPRHMFNSQSKIPKYSTNSKESTESFYNRNNS